MKLTPFIRSKALSVFTASALALSHSALADDPPKIDIEKAKAELAKARAKSSEKQQTPTPTPTPPAPAEKVTPAKKATPAEVKAKPAEAEKAVEAKKKESVRKRLFSRSRKAPEAPVAKLVKPAEVTAADAKKETEEAKPNGRRKLFSRDRKERAPETKPEEKSAEIADKAKVEPQTDDGSDKQGRRRLLFGRNRDKAEPIEPSPEIEKNVAEGETPEKIVEAEAEPAAEKKVKRRLFARSLSENNDAPEIAEKPKKKSGRLFGFGGDGSKDFAKADRTKLGNSVESDASSVTVVKKKTSAAGELGWYVVTEADVPFYAVGPGQPMPPEKMLDRGSMLTVTKGGWGWCNVRLGSGELGVVSSKVMRPATVAEISRHNGGSMTASRSRGNSRLFNILSRGPAPKLELPTSSSESEPIRNFGLLPPVSE